MVRWLLVGLSLLLSTGCQPGSLTELATALNERGVSHCLSAQVAVAPYGHAYLYAKSGDLDCEALWRARWRLEGP